MARPIANSPSSIHERRAFPADHGTDRPIHLIEQLPPIKHTMWMFAQAAQAIEDLIESALPGKLAADLNLLGDIRAATMGKPLLSKCRFCGR
jgi:hypothetical protein